MPNNDDTYSQKGLLDGNLLVGLNHIDTLMCVTLSRTDTNNWGKKYTGKKRTIQISYLKQKSQFHRTPGKFVTIPSLSDNYLNRLSIKNLDHLPAVSL